MKQSTTILKPKATTVYFKGLNGLRAISAMAVLGSHINMSLQQFGLPGLPTLDLAGFGVTIFFSLSGFLITYLLLEEKQVTGTVAIPKFYARRILRIWPLYFLYLFMAVSVAQLLTNFVISHDLLYYLFFVSNIPFVFGGLLPYLAHYWSLAVEEQFYIFWPWLIKYTKNMMVCLVAFVIGFLLLKVFCNVVYGGNSLIYTVFYVTRFDCMAIGAIGAWILYFKKQHLLNLLNNPVTEIAAWLILCVVALNSFHILSIIDHEIIAGVTVVLILNQCYNKNPLLSLENKFLNFVGSISFGIYVYHPLLITLLAFLPWALLPEAYYVKIGIVYAAIVSATVGISYLSYKYFEKPVLIFKEKFAIISSTNKV
jgi:peptidoglycan/LPS O-acetylase OafA/YrhL